MSTLLSLCGRMHFGCRDWSCMCIWSILNLLYGGHDDGSKKRSAVEGSICLRPRHEDW